MDKNNGVGSLTFALGLLIDKRRYCPPDLPNSIRPYWEYVAQVFERVHRAGEFAWVGFFPVEESPHGS